MARLAFVSGYWPTRDNPISGVFLVRQVQALAELGHSVTVMVPRTMGKAPQYLDLPALEVDGAVDFRSFPVLRAPGRLDRRGMFFRWGLKVTGRALRKELRADAAQGSRFDGCIVHDLRYGGLSAPIWQTSFGGPKICLINGIDPILEDVAGTRFLRDAMTEAIRAFGTFAIVGSHLADHMSALGVLRDLVDIVPNGADLPPAGAVRPFVRPGRGRPKYILSVSNLIELKGVGDTIAALSILSARGMDDFELRIVGDGPLRSELQALIARKGLGDKVTFLGRLPHGETLAEMARCDIFCLPSWAEAFGIVYLEAMAQGRPVIGCCNCGPADFVTDGLDGMLVAPKDPEAVADALSALWKAPERLERMSIAARRTAEGYSWRANAEMLIERLGL